jgi:archaellum component FlaC
MLKPDFDPRMYTKAMTRSISVLTGEEPPTRYKVQPNISDLGVEEAKTILAGDGVDVVDTIRAGDKAAVAKLRERSSIDADDLVRENRSVSPGDKVALIVENGVAVDYVKVESGGGKNLFDRPAGAVAVPDVDFEGKADAALAGFEEKIAAKVAELDSAGTDFDTALSRRKEEVAAAGADLARIGETRAGVAAEIESLRNDITRLRAERETIARDIGTAAAELDRVRTVHDDVNREVAVVKGELASIVELQRTTLADAAREREKLVESIRRETPVTAVVGTEANFGTALVNRGVTNVGGLAGLSDADLEATARESGLNLATARRLRREADARIGAPIR